ncbi:Kelch motif containing isoform B [Micractinium conductrix]|uniref:Kelch motif containing isoform B n=1 Tax=Micractinium conductrix TaxID=554055 RepID=A0A2P6V8J5_9CHLO|nr:Kelch motif containing isoform B [Micractinium conductrix]|eukprot:PSC70412.1 Kelch motif containing isoform B [Micractinium conductrix]
MWTLVVRPTTVCNNHTYHQCMELQMFGLPQAHWCYVQHIRAGMPLFLYNFASKQLHGIFKPASDGTWEIDPNAGPNAASPLLLCTRLDRRVEAHVLYPCQVTFETYLACPAIPIDQVRPLIAENLIGNSDKFQQELSKKQVTELCALFRRKYDAQHGRASSSSVVPPDGWPGMGGGAGAGGAVAAAPPSNRWMEGAGGAANGSGYAAVEVEPAGPADLGGKTYAQIQEEARKAARAAKAAGGSSSSSAGAGSSAAAAAAALSRLQLVKQQQQQAAAAPTRPAPQAAAAPPPPQQQQQAAAAAPASSAAAAAVPRSGVEELGDELLRFKTTLKPLTTAMQNSKLEAQLRMAASLQGHLSKLDDALMKVEKERGKDCQDNQKLKEQLQQMQMQNRSLLEALQSRGGASGGAAAAAGSSSAAAAAAPAAAPAKPAGGDDMYLTGGNCGDSTGEGGGWLSSSVVYNTRSGTWRRGPDMPLMRGYGCSAVLGHHLYVMGGGKSSEWLSDCQRLDVRTGAWTADPQMAGLRGCAGAAALGNRIYVCDGGVADNYYETVEILNPEMGAFMTGPKLRTKRFSTAAATLDGCVYVAGGYDGSYLQSAERLDPREGKWQVLPDMAERRGAHALSAGPGACCTRLEVEVFDPRANAWQPRAPMQQGRAYGVAAFAGGMLCAAGGMSGEEYNESFERYDPLSNAWVTVPLPPASGTKRAFLCAGVVSAGGAHAGGSGQTKQLEGGGSTAGGGASTASFAAARPPRPLPRSLRLMRGVDTAVTLFSLLLQLSLALRWGGGLSGCQLLHQAALVAFRSTALYLALRLPTRAWYRYRVLLIFALRLSIATVPSQRSAQDGDAVLLARPTTPGAAGAAKDWLRMLTGTRLLQMSLIGSLLLQPPLAVAAQQAALMYLTSDNAAFCGTRLLQDPLSQRRLAALWSFMQGWAQLAAALSTAVAPDAAHVPAHLLPRVRCLAVLTFHQSFLGILLPVIVAACTAPGPLPLALLEARGVPAGAAVAQTSVAPCAGVAVTDDALHILVASAGSQSGEGALEVICAQPLFATPHAVAVLPAAGGGGGSEQQQDCLALLNNSGCLSILRYDACQARFVALQQLRLPPELPEDPLRLLAVHPRGHAVAVASMGGTLCLFTATGSPAAAAPSSGASCSSGGGGDGGGGGPFSGPLVVLLRRQLWSLAFEDDGAATVPAAAAAAAPAPLRLAALHEHPRGEDFAAVSYAVRCVSDGASLAGIAEILTFLPLSSQLTAASAGRDGGGSSPRLLLGQPRALVQLPAGHSGAHVVLRERGLQLVAPAAAAREEGALPAAEEAQRWWQQHERLHRLQQWAQLSAAAAAQAAAEEGWAGSPTGPGHEGLPLCPPCIPRDSSVAAAAEGGEPMALSQQPSAGSMDTDEYGDEEMRAAEEEEAGPAGGAPHLASSSSGGGSGMASDAFRDMDEAVAVAMQKLEEEGTFLTSCCWEAAASGQQRQQPVLVCAREDGALCRVPLPGPDAWPHAADGSLAIAPQPARLQRRLGSPASCLAALPGGLLMYCTDAAGLQLLQRSSPAPAAASSSTGGGEAALGYEPLLPPHLLAAQQGLDAAAAPGAPGCCTLPAAGAVADCALADLEGAVAGGGDGRQAQQQRAQQQLYAVCRSTAAGGGGSLCVLYQDAKPEVVFDLPGAAERITGMWGLRLRPSDPQHSLALLSFVGGSRLLAAQGGVFRDVTDRHALHASAQTLAAGNLEVAEPHAAAPAGTAVVAPAIAQVTSRGVVLFGTAAAAMSRQSSGALGSSSGGGGGGGGPGFAWEAPAGCTIGAAAVAEQGVLAFCTGPTRQLFVLLPAPPAGSVGGDSSGQEPPLPRLVEAACLAMQAEVSCASNLVLLPAQLQGPLGRRCAVFAVGAYASQVLLMQLRWEPKQPERASLAVLQHIDLTASSVAGSLPDAAALAAAAAASPLSPRALQRQQLTPESLLLLPGDGGSLAGTGTPAEAAGPALEASLVVGLRTGSLLQLRCSLQGGAARQQQAEPELLALSLGQMPVVLLPLPQQQPTAAVAVGGAAPPAAAVLCDRVSLLHSGTAGSGAGRVRCQQLGLPQVQAAAALLLDSRGLASSSFLVDAPGAGAGPLPQAGPAQQQQLFLLCAASDGCLRMVALDPQPLPSSRCWPLPQRMQPSRLAVHAASGSVVVGGSVMLFDSGSAAHAAHAVVQVIDPATGEALARYAGFMPAETITSLAVWDPTETLPQQQPQQQPQQPQQAQQAQQGSPARAGAADAGGTAGEGGGEGLRSHPIALSPESPGSTAAAAAAAALEAAPGATAAAAAADEERPWGGFIVVGTSIDQGGGFGSHPKDKWDDESSAVLQGRLLLLQLTTATAASASGAGGSGAPAAASAAEPWEPPRRRLQLLPVAQMRLPSRVLALCPGSTRLTGSAASAGAAGAGASAGGSREGPAAPRLFASVGRRLVALEWRARQQLLRRVAWTPTNRPLASLQVAGGLLAAADRGEGATLYRYNEPPPGSEQEREQQRARLARRFRFAPPGVAELRQQLGLQHHRHPLHGPGGPGAGGGAAHTLGDEVEAGFSVVAADCACRPAVGTVALTARRSDDGAASSGDAAPPAQTAAVLDATGELRLLRQRWPKQEPVLHQRCAFRLGSPAVALLPGGLSWHGGSTGTGASTAAAGAAAPPVRAEMLAVLGGGGAVALQPVPAEHAQQLLALQAALAQHEASAPLSGAAWAAFRGARPDGPFGNGEAPAVTFHHPPPAAADLATAELLAPASPRLASEQLEPAGPAGAPRGMAGATAEAPVGGLMAVGGAGGSGGGGSAATARKLGVGTSPRHAPPPQQAAEEAVLDGDLLQLYLRMHPAEQLAVLAKCGGALGGGGAGGAPSLVQRAAQLSNLVAQLLL